MTYLEFGLVILYQLASGEALKGTVFGRSAVYCGQSLSRCRSQSKLCLSSCPNDKEQEDERNPMVSVTSTSLSALFNSALAHQQDGNFAAAVAEYEGFLAGAADAMVPDAFVAEVYVNLGQICARQADRAGARAHFLRALEQRQISAAHVNLALLALADGSDEVGQPGLMKRAALEDAAQHCESALRCEDCDSRTATTATRILADIRKQGITTKGKGRIQWE